MKKYSLKITIDPSGDVGIDVNGIKGKGCTELTKQLENALGKVSRRALKSEAAASGGVHETLSTKK